MEQMLEQFKKIAPYITANVKSRLNGSETEEEVAEVIKQEIVHYFEACQSMFTQYLAFNTDQRRAFAQIMHKLVAPLANNMKTETNPVYLKFTNDTGKAGAFDFICHQFSNHGDKSNANLC